MKRLALLVLGLASVVALAQTTSAFSVSSSTNLTMACADAGLISTSGASLSNAIGYSVVESADQTDGGVQTLFATGTDKCCAYLPTSSVATGAPGSYRWMPCPTTLDFSLASVCTTGARDCPSGDFQPLVGVGRVAYVHNGLVSDGGLTATTTIVVRRRQ